MDILKSWASTLCVAVVFISVANIIVPHNVMKKHVKFALSLILLAVMVLPITQLLSIGEDFESFNYDINSTLDNQNSGEITKEIYSSEFLRKNLEMSLVNTLKEEFVGKDFEVSVEGDLNVNNGIDITKVNIGINDVTRIKKVDKIVISENEKEASKEVEEDSFIKELKDYVSKELQISSDKIKARYL